MYKFIFIDNVSDDIVYESVGNYNTSNQAKASGRDFLSANQYKLEIDDISSIRVASKLTDY